MKFLDEKIKVVANLTGIISIFFTLNLEEIFYAASYPTLRVYPLCGQFIENWKELYEHYKIEIAL